MDGYFVYYDYDVYYDGRDGVANDVLFNQPQVRQLRVCNSGYDNFGFVIVWFVNLLCRLVRQLPLCGVDFVDVNVVFAIVVCVNTLTAFPMTCTKI